MYAKYRLVLLDIKKQQGITAAMRAAKEWNIPFIDAHIIIMGFFPKKPI